MRPGVVALVGVFWVSVARADETFGGPDIYPLAVGATWTFKVAGQEDRFTVKVAAEEKVGGQNCFRIEATLRGTMVATEHLAVKADGIYRYRSDKDDVHPPLRICSIPSKKGESWSTDFKAGDETATAKFKSDFDAVAVPAGKHKAVQVAVEVTKGTSTVKTTYWFAPKVGIVKQVFEEGKRTITLELEKFELPKR